MLSAMKTNEHGIVYDQEVINLLKTSIENNKIPYETINVDPTIADSFKGDIHGLFNYLEIGPEFWIANTLLNGLTSPLDYEGYYIIKIADSNVLLSYLTKTQMN